MPTMHPTHSSGRVRSRLLVAVIATAAVLAAACGGGDGGSGGSAAGACPVDAVKDASGTTQVTLWHAYVGLTKKTLEKLAGQYNAEQTKVKVNVEAQGTYEELLKKYEDALNDPATLPDVILTEDTTTQFMSDSGGVIPAQACIDADPDAKKIYDGILPAVTAAYTVEDQLLPGAFSVSTPVLYSNRDLLAKAGLPTDTYPQTLAELRTTAEKIKAANLPGVAQPLVMKVDSWYIEHWLTGVKQPVVNNDNGRSALATKSTYENKYTTETFQWMKDMVDAGLLKAVPNSSQIDDFLAAATQSAAMLIQTSTAITTVNGVIEGSLNAEDLGLAGDAGKAVSGFKIPNLNIGVGLLPGLKSAGEGQIGGSAWYLLDTGKDAEAAGGWQFLKWFNETPNQVTWTLEGSYLPVSEAAAADPKLKENWATTRTGQWLSVAFQGIADLDPKFPGPVIGPYKEFRAANRAALETVTLSGQPVDAAIKGANTAFQKALDSYAKDVGAGG
jgi:ABC-type glycerol-3-phosphate transport system substrate-binding protein